MAAATVQSSKLNRPGRLPHQGHYTNMELEPIPLDFDRAPISLRLSNLRRTIKQSHGYATSQTNKHPNTNIEPSLEELEMEKVSSWRQIFNNWKEKTTASHLATRVIFKDEAMVIREARNRHRATKETLNGTAPATVFKPHQKPQASTTPRQPRMLKRARTESEPTGVSKRVKTTHKDPQNGKTMQSRSTSLTTTTEPTQLPTPTRTTARTGFEARIVALERMQAEYETLKAELDRLQAKKTKTIHLRVKKIYRFKLGKRTHDVTYPAIAKIGQPLNRMRVHNKKHTSSVYH